MKWSELSNSKRDALVHEKVMGLSLVCSEEIEPVEDHSGFACPTCHAVFSVADSMTMDDGTSHLCNDIPHYTTSMDAAWQVVRRINNPNSPAFPDYQKYANFIDELVKLVGSDMFFDLFYCDHEGDHLTPERLCIAALRACGTKVEV